jgi:multidrug efflux pump subunit AcrA (membrane-fusion protein)
MRNPIASFILSLAGFLLLAACNESRRSPTPSKPVPVRVIKAEYRSVPDAIQAPGSVQPRRRVVVSSQLNGFVRDVRVKAGESVKAGQVLVTLDARDAEGQKAGTDALMAEARAALEEASKSAAVAESMRTAARASHDLASQTLTRYQKLFEARSVSSQELDEVRARLDTAAADLAAKETMVAAAADRLNQVRARISHAQAQSTRADVLLGWTVIRASSDGAIAQRLVDPGTAIFPGSTLIVVESTRRPQVLASLPSVHASYLRLGLEVRVLMGQKQAAVLGQVAEIIPLSDPDTHTVQFKVDLPDDFRGPTGDYATVVVPAGSKNALLIPQQAIRETGQLTGVFVVDGSSTARFRLVKAVPYDSERMELLAGIEAGDRIVADLTDRLSEGASLEIRP